MEKRVLGRGLSALIPEKIQDTADKQQAGVINIPIDKIKANKFQPRKDFDKDTLKDLTSSIKEKGLIQPVLVRYKDNEYELITGERRFRAAKMLNFKEIPAIVKNVSDLDSLELSIIENVQREDLNPIDQAKAYKQLIEEFNMTQENIAEAIGKDRATIANILRLLKLSEKIQEYVSRGTISMGHARAILGLSSDREQSRLCTKVIKNDLSVRDTERYAKKMQSGTKKTISNKDPNLIDAEELLKEALGTKVKIIKSKKGGKIEIEFYSDNDLERVITILKSRR
ncbi:MAG: ParB/RepB/Spo0J family partition protein [Candidatus Omnitrophica bacterium]|nr:ParB/RepB/Spo0J family partition protein [Candidatus Omnitrophota bacterium]